MGRGNDVELNRIAVLWLVLREHIPNTGNKVEDVFVGQHLGAMFTGDRDAMLEYTEREQRGQRSPEEQFQMMVAVDRAPYLLDPDEAVRINEGDMYRLAKGHCPDGLGEDTIYVPRIPRDAAEANAMMETFTILSDATKPTADPKGNMRLYAGYSEAELMRGGVGVSVPMTISQHMNVLKRSTALITWAVKAAKTADKAAEAAAKAAGKGARS